MDAIAEGVEMSSNTKPPVHQPVHKKKLSLNTPPSTSPINNLSSPDIENVGRALASTSLNTSSTPSLNKDDEELDSGSPTGKSVLKKLASIFKKDKSKDSKDEEKDKENMRKSSKEEKMSKSPSNSTLNLPERRCLGSNSNSTAT